MHVRVGEARDVVADALDLIGRVTTVIPGPGQNQVTFRVLREDEAVVDQFVATIEMRIR